MRIKSLSLKGFKTFYEKSVVNFNNKISAIVGPNGCGKTNLLDALRWVLGEQNPRLLRTDSMIQLISDGNDKLPKQGFAEISLIIDTHDHEDLPEEIEIKRRLTRNGDSLYYLNGENCKLKDITELVITIGAGSRTFTVIPQGQIESYITAKAEDKRQLIDEAAGLGKYKIRRHETERKIILTKDNLNRINDIKEEVGLQRESLRQQAEKSNEYNTLVDKYKKIEKLFYKKRFKDLNLKLETAIKDKEDFQQTILIIEESKFLKNKELEDLEQNIKSNKLDLDSQNSKILSDKERLFKIDSEIKTINSENELIKQGLESLKNFKSEAVQELNDILIEKEKKQKLLNSTTLNYDKIVSDMNNKDSELEDESSIKKRLFDAVERLSSQKTSANLLENELEQLKIKKFDCGELSSKSESQISDLMTNMKKIQDDISNLETIRDKCEVNKKDEIENLKNIQKNLEEINTKHIKINSEIEATKSKVEVLENIELNYEWLPEGIREFVNKLKGKNIEGILSDFIKPMPGFEKAVESFLGEKLKWILIKNSDNTINAIEEFKQSSSGRGTFVPLDYRTHSGASSSLECKNIIDCIECSTENRPFLASIFGETYVVDTLKDALNLKRDYPGLNFVTKDGEYFDSNGSITVGSAPDNIIQIKEEIKKLNILKDKYDTQIDQLVMDRKEIEDEIFDINSRIKLFDSEIESQNVNYLKLSNSISDIKSNLASEISSKSNIENQILDLETEISDKVLRIEKIKDEISDIVLEKKSYEDKFNQITVSDNENIKNIINAKNNEERERLDSQRKSLLLDMQNITSKANKLEDKIDEISNKIILDEEKFEKNLSLKDSKNIKKSELEKCINVFNAEVNNIKSSIIANERIVNEVKEQIKDFIKKIDIKRSELEEYDSKLHKAKIEIDQLLEQLTDMEYNEDIRNISDSENDEISTMGESELAKSKFYKLQKTIDDFGPVNLLAPEEFKKLDERFEFLDSQIIDLQNSLDNLSKTISKIDQESESAFLDTFNRITSKYDEYVKRLFGGGEGKLILTNPDSPKDSGIEVMLKIGLKKYRNLKSYSGGERALAGIALLLSAYFVRPAPFLLLDEVDAPLDDKNILKFGEMLDEISNLSQVAIITHNKTTMKFAKQLIGVTSRLEGISEVVPIDLSN